MASSSGNPGDGHASPVNGSEGSTMSEELGATTLTTNISNPSTVSAGTAVRNDSGVPFVNGANGLAIPSVQRKISHDEGDDVFDDQVELRRKFQFPPTDQNILSDSPLHKLRRYNSTLTNSYVNSLQYNDPAVMSNDKGTALRHHPPRLQRVLSMSDLIKTTGVGNTPIKASKEGKKAVLQIVVPQSLTDRTDDYPVMHSENFDQVPSGTPPNGRSTRPTSLSGSQSQQDLRALAQRMNYAQQFAYVNPMLNRSDSDIDLLNQNTLTDRGSVVGSLKNKLDHEENDPPPTSPEEKKHVFSVYLLMTASLIYGLCLIVIGFLAYITEVATPLRGVAAIFNLYLITVSFIYLIYLYVDVSIYHSKVMARESFRRSIEEAEVQFQESREGNLHLSIEVSAKKLKESRDALPKKYDFATGRHAGSIYLKIGAAVFCFGHLIHSILLVVYQAAFFHSENRENCASIISILFDVIYPIYSIFQLFLIFKYSHVIINHRKAVATFFLTHCISTTMCYWMWAIIRETMDYIATYVNSKGNYTDPYFAFLKEADIIIDENAVVRHYCAGPEEMWVIRDNYSPYLYPFTIEYSIIVAGILYVVWSNIGKVHGDKESEEYDTNTISDIGKTPIEPAVISSNLVVSVDCRSTNKGLFAGMIALIIGVISIIMYFIAIGDDDMEEVGSVVNESSELALLVSLTLGVVWVYLVYFRKLDVNHHPVSMLDDLLLFICMPAFFLYFATSFASAIIYEDALHIVVLIFFIIQVMIQTPFIIDGLRRCCNSQKIRLRKPGREIITFLIITNVAMWITETFEIKSHERLDHRYDLFGKTLWTIIKHATMPLIVFYRFHSSVCLVDIWKSAYEKGD